MATINKELLRKFVDSGFFNEWKTLEGVINKLDQKGFSVKGKQASLLAQLLTFLCQEDTLERSRDEKGLWKYKKLSEEKHG